MYEPFYGLTGKPFSLLPDAEMLFPSRRHKRALASLDYGLTTQVGFIAITGDVGAGKTTLIRHFLKKAQRDLIIGVLTNTSSTMGSLLGWVATAFDINGAEGDATALYNKVVEFLVETYGRGRRAVLIIDEAQNLTPAQLEDLRMISNVNNEKDLLLQIVLVGQPELLDTLRQHAMRQLVQRIAVHCHLDPLTPAETAAYITYRLENVGGTGNLFEPRAVAAVHYFSGGVPRLINLLCDFALVYGFSEDRKNIGIKDILEIAHDRNRMGLTPFKPMLPDDEMEAAFYAIAAQIEKGDE